LVFVDIIAILGGALVALWLWALRSNRSFSDLLLISQAGWLLILGLSWLVLAVINDLYSLQTTGNLRATFHALFRISALLLAVYVVMYFFAPPRRLPRAVVLFFTFASSLLVGLWRILYLIIFSRIPFQQRALIVGAGWAGQSIARVLKENRDFSYRLVGFIDDDPQKQGQLIEEQPVLGNRRDLISLVKERVISALILAITYEIHDELFGALTGCLERGVRIIPMPLLYEELTGRIPVQHIGDNWYVAMPLDLQGTGVLYPAFRRIMDIFLASLGLLLLGLTFPFIALAVYLDSPGPIFYTQERLGKGGRVFRLFKLRTMFPEAETQTGPVWAQQRDARFTRVGRPLRATHIDELPQLVNVLKGDMSIVGPRPERPEFVAELEKHIPFYRLRHAVRPGMAGWALVNYGYGSSLEDALAKLEYDLYYIKHQSLYLDLLIFLKTIGRMLSFRGR